MLMSYYVTFVYRGQRKGSKTKGMGGEKEFETTKNGMARYTIASRIQITDSTSYRSFFSFRFLSISLSFFTMHFIVLHS